MAYFKKDEEGKYWKFCPAGPQPRWMNKAGRFGPFNLADLKRYDIYEAERFEDLPWSDTFLATTLDYGWIDPKGGFWGCAHRDHENVMTWVLGVAVQEAEADGWIRVFPNRWEQTADITWQQADTLFHIGRSPVRHGYRSPKVQFESVFPEGYGNRALPEKNARRVEDPSEVLKNLPQQGSVPFKLQP